MESYLLCDVVRISCWYLSKKLCGKLLYKYLMNSLFSFTFNSVLDYFNTIYNSKLKKKKKW